jgi:GTPase involved in cell partitioning and DNA repair
MISANTQRYIQIQDIINDQIGQDGEADIELIDELETLGRELTRDEISIIFNYMDALNEDQNVEYEDAEWENS